MRPMNDHLPVIKEDILERIDILSKDSRALEGYAKNMIKTLQTHPVKSKFLEDKQLETAAVVGVEIMEALAKEFEDKMSI